MQGSIRTAVFLLVLSAILAGGLFLMGVFDSGVDAPPSSETASGRGGTTTTAGGSGAAGGQTQVPIQTSGFSADGDAAAARVEDRSTGLKVHGEVRSPDGALLSGAVVALIRDVSQIRQRMQEGDEVARVTTKKAGTFAFHDLEPGQVYILRAAHADYTTERVHPIDSADPATMHQVVRLGDGVSVFGDVKDDAGAAIAGARIEVFDIAVSSVSSTPPPERWAESGADGAFDVPHLSPGVKRVFVHKEGYATDGTSSVRVGGDADPVVLSYTLSRGAVIAGQVVDQGSGEPVAGARIVARPLSLLPNTVARPNPPVRAPDEGQVGEIGESTATTQPRFPQAVAGSIQEKAFLIRNAVSGEDGRFEITGLMRARYTLRVFAPGFNRTRGRTVDSGTTELRIGLVPSPRIIGRVVDGETGEPLSRFSVSSSQHPNPMYLQPHTRQRFQDREDGSFTYLDARVGLHYLLVDAEGYAGGRSAPVTVSRGTDATGVEIKMVRGASVSGLVTTEDGRPIGGVEVTLVPGRNNNLPSNPFTDAITRTLKMRGSRRVLTDGGGLFHFPNVLGGNYQASLIHEDYEDMESPNMEIPDSGAMQIGPFSLAEGGIIEGTVTTADGQPDSKAQVMLISFDENGRRYNDTAKTDGSGVYRFKGLAPGQYRMMIAMREGRFQIEAMFDPKESKARIVTVKSGETLRANF